MNLGCLVSLLTSPSLAVAACPCVCGCAWIICSFVCVCYMPGSVPPFASVSAVFVPIPGLSAPPFVSAVDLAVAYCRYLSLCLWLCLGYLFFYLCLLCAWFRSSICVSVCCAYACTWFVSFSVYVCCLCLCLGCLLIFFNFFIVSLNQSINQGHLRRVRS